MIFLFLLFFGILLGIFFPGDSLLFAAGLLSAAGFLAPIPLMIFVVIAAIIGDSVGYWFGANVGINFFKRKDSRFFKQEYVKRTELFYQKYGGRAVVLARFVPIVRTIAPILAGSGVAAASVAPKSAGVVLRQRALLQQQPAAGIEDENRKGAVQLSAPMRRHLFLDADFVVILVNERYLIFHANTFSSDQ